LEIEKAMIKIIVQKFIVIIILLMSNACIKSSEFTLRVITSFFVIHSTLPNLTACR